MVLEDHCKRVGERGFWIGEVNRDTTGRNEKLMHLPSDGNVRPFALVERRQRLAAVVRNSGDIAASLDSNLMMLWLAIRPVVLLVDLCLIYKKTGPLWKGDRSVLDGVVFAFSV